MSDIDLSRLPTGSMGWRALVDWAAESDDRVERFFLELKSDVDLTTKHGRHRVAKFVLGSAHRDPARASRRFGGHAVMLLGVARHAVLGIPPFEAKDLAREVMRFTGSEGPIWDYELVPVDADHDVVAIIVDPPSGRVWPCLADGEGLVDGDVYIRGDGETSKAKGSELRAIVDRGNTTSSLPDVEVELIGSASAIRLDDDVLLAWIEDRVAELRDQGRPQSRTAGIQLLGAGSMDHRSRAEFLKQVEAWYASAASVPHDGVRDLVAAMTPTMQVRIRNNTKQFLRDVRVDLTFSGAVEALYRVDPEDAVPFPDVPKDFGSETLAHILGGQNFRAAMPSDHDREVIIAVRAPARISVSMRELRPEEEFTSDDDEFVICRFVTTADPIAITGQWSLTAGDIHDIKTSDFSVEPEYRDWIDPIAELLRIED